MKARKIIEFVGASEEDVAHLRLLMRKAAPQLDAHWFWGAEDAADVVVADPRTLIGDGARLRALQRGVPCLTVVDAPMPGHEDDLILPRPFRLDAVVALLNRVTGDQAAKLDLVDHDGDFFLVDLGDDVDGGYTGVADGMDNEASWSRPSDPTADAFEAMFKRDPMAESLRVLLPDSLRSDAGIDSVGPQSIRSRARGVLRDIASTSDIYADEAALQQTRPGAAPQRRPSRHDTQHTLLEYLDPQLLAAPSRLLLPGATELVLDPKTCVFHAEGGLPALELYCLQPICRSSWQPLITDELEHVRATLPAWPYVRLEWLYHLLHSGGRLASHLDPGGTYRLTRWFELAQHYPLQFRIATSLLRPQRLDEIAAACRARMDDVIDVVNAYDAIGYVQWYLRDRLSGDQPTRSDPDGKPPQG